LVVFRLISRLPVVIAVSRLQWRGGKGHGEKMGRNVAMALTVAGALIGGPRQSAVADGEAVTNTTRTSTTDAVRETQAQSTRAPR